MPLLDYDAGGYENGLSRERDPYTLQHHSKEDKQVSVLTNQGENLVYGGHVVVILLLPYNHTARGRLLGTDMTPLDARDFLSKRQEIAAIHEPPRRGLLGNPHTKLCITSHQARVIPAKTRSPA